MHKKKTGGTKLIVLLLALCLLVGATIGGTLAWLITQTEPVVNTFTVGNIQINLTEVNPADKDAIKMVPGTEITKDPKVTVTGGSEACWLFVKVKAENGVVLEGTPAATDFLTCAIASGWTKVAGEADSVVYGRQVNASAADQIFSVLDGDKVHVLKTVTKAMMDSITEANAPKLTFTAYAIQSANLKKGDTPVATAEEAWAVYNQSAQNP